MYGETTMKQRRDAPKGRGSQRDTLLVLKVFIIDGPFTDGPFTEKFLKENPEISRTIAIRGDQTLQQLHRAIFRAFDREEEHFYEFQFGKGPDDLAGPRYLMPEYFALPLYTDVPEDFAGTTDQTTMGSLELTVGRSFGYLFDYGDNWQHQIDVIAIQDEIPKGRYPKVTERVGDSPPQYPDWDEEEG